MIEIKEEIVQNHLILNPVAIQFQNIADIDVILNHLTGRRVIERFLKDGEIKIQDHHNRIPMRKIV